MCATFNWIKLGARSLARASVNVNAVFEIWFSATSKSQQSPNWPYIIPIIAAPSLTSATLNYANSDSSSFVFYFFPSRWPPPPAVSHAGVTRAACLFCHAASRLRNRAKFNRDAAAWHTCLFVWHDLCAFYARHHLMSDPGINLRVCPWASGQQRAESLGRSPLAISSGVRKQRATMLPRLLCLFTNGTQRGSHKNLANFLLTAHQLL